MSDEQDETDALEANQSFYVAFAAGDLDAMDELWAREAAVTCIHPGWDGLHTRARVMESWRAILSAGGAQVRCESATAHLVGPVAWVLCHEHVPGGVLIATNVFVFEDGLYRMVHHHAGPLADAARTSAGERQGPPTPRKLVN